MRLHRPSLAAACAAALLLSACGRPDEAAPDESSVPADELASADERRSQEAEAEAAAEAVRTPQQLDALFEQAATEARVPVELLKALSYVETRWEMVQGEAEFEGQQAAHGLMALRGEALVRGAALAGVSEEAARTEPLANIRAAAALLSAEADALGLDRTQLSAWAPAVAAYNPLLTDAEARALYVHEEVYALLRRGAVARTPEGGVAVTLFPQQVEADYPRPTTGSTVSADGVGTSRQGLTAAPDYPAGVWRPSPNYNARPSGDIGKPAFIVIHTCEGSYTSCWSWLTNSAAGASAHYVVKEDGSEISQLVRESHRAWHVGASYDCSLNSSVECWRNGYSVNHFSVGIEHGGYASQASFPSGQIAASAKLSCDISKAWGIKRDRYHIVAHGKLQPYNRTDPGPNWPWTDYLNRVNSYCGATALVVDSNNANNNTSQGYIEVSSNWVSSASTAGYYGSGYWYASTQAVSDPATFWFYLPAAATKTIDAWWTAGTNRSSAAPFIVFNASGTKLATVTKDQRSNGGKWNALGTWSFQAGWNRVQLSRWAAEGSVVIADAIRVR